MTQSPIPARLSRVSTFVAALIGLIALAGCASATRDGQMALLAGDNTDAVAYFDAALAKDPTNVTALVGLGVARYRLGLFAEADRALSDALVQVPDLPVAHLYLGLSALRRGEDTAADTEFARFAGLGVAPRLAAYIDRSMRLLRTIPASEDLRAYITDGIADQAAWAGEVTDAWNAASYARGSWYNDTRVYYVVRGCRCR